MQGIGLKSPVTVNKEDLTNLKGLCYKGTVFVVTQMPQDVPISSVVIMDDGEIRASWRDPAYRGSENVKRIELYVVLKALESGDLNPTGGTLYAIVHPDNTYANETMHFRVAGIESTLEVVDREGTAWNKWSVPVSKLLAEVKRMDESKDFVREVERNE